MKTLQIGDKWLGDQSGGLARYYWELLQHLPATGTDYQGLVVGSDEIARATAGKIVGFAPAEAPLPQRWLACRQAGRNFGKIDLIAVHFAVYAIPWLDRFHSTPTVVHFHGPWAGESSASGATGLNTRFKRAIEKMVYGRARRFIVLSRAFREQLETVYKVEKGRICVVPGGVDINRFHTNLSRREARERLGWPQDRFIILTIRRQVKRMGLENLIDAVRDLAAQCPEVLVLLGGKGPLAGELQERVRQHGLEQHVRLLGMVPDDDLPTAYRAADLSVVPSESLEGFGLITLESLASGTPVLVTPVGGLPEVISPFAPQCIFPDASAGAMSSMMGEFVRGSSTLPSEESCRNYAVDSFSWARIAEQVRDVYDEACR